MFYFDYSVLQGVVVNQTPSDCFNKNIFIIYYIILPVDLTFIIQEKMKKGVYIVKILKGKIYIYFIVVLDNIINK